jgi:predicted amidophosphoribosyltransferase
MRKITIGGVKRRTGRAMLKVGDKLAEALSAHAKLPMRNALERIRYTTTQTAFDRSERMENLRDAFRLRKKADVRRLRVLLIDDVLTTGSTLSECARVLKASGAISVELAAARMTAVVNRLAFFDYE